VEKGDHIMHHQAALMPAVPSHPSDEASAQVWVKDVSLLGKRVTAVAIIDTAEHGRRLEYGCGPVTDPALLDRLLELPLGSSVPDPVVWAETADQPPGVVKRSADGITVTRCLAPPLAIADVIVAAPAGQELRAVQDASLFARFARRWMMTTRHRLPEPVVLEAKLCGVGILGPSGALLFGEAFTTRDTDAWGWMLREKVYKRWLSQPPQDRAMGSPARATGEATATQRG
jgi:hypothetical protein